MSTALLLAIGGGVAVANSTSANADSNYEVTPETSATVNSLEANPASGQSVAPSSVASKSAKASAKAPAVPNPSLIGEDNVNDNNASATYYRDMQDYDIKVQNFYGPIVKSYVNSINNRFPKQASALNGNYASAANQQKNDRSLASSYSAIAARPNWSNEVSNIASAKSGVDASEYIETVGYNVSNNASTVSNYANELSGASSVASLATLISEINGNTAISAEYSAYAISANAESEITSNDYSDVTSLDADLVNDSAANQQDYWNAIVASTNNSANDRIARNNSAQDIKLVQSIADTTGMTTSAVSSEVSSAAKNNANLTPVFNAVSAGKSPVTFVDTYYTDSAALSSAKSGSAYYASVNNKFSSISSTANSYALSSYNTSIAYNVASALAYAFNYNDGANKSVSDVASSASAKYTGQNFSTAAAYTNLINTIFHTQANSSEASDTALAVINPMVTKAQTKSNLANTKYSSYNASGVASVSGVNYTNNSTVASVIANNTGSASSAVSSFAITSSEAVTNDSYALSNDASNASLSDEYRLLWDTSAQQVYGANKSAADKTIASAKATSASDSVAVNSENNVVNSARANSVSASNNDMLLNVLGNDPTLADIVQANDGHGLVSSASAFYDAPASGYANVSAALEGTSSEASETSVVNSAANAVGADYTSASNSSVNYVNSTDANFVLAQSYAGSYADKSGSDQANFNSASDARVNFYTAYAGDEFGSDEAAYNTAAANEPNDKDRAHGYGIYVQKHEPHFITVIKNAMLHTNPNYNEGKTLTKVPAGAQLGVIGIGFDNNGRTRLMVNYNHSEGYITANRSYIEDTYLVPGEVYNVTFGRDAVMHNNLVFTSANKAGSVAAGTTVKGTAVANDDGFHFLPLTRLQLANGKYVTTNSSYITSATPVNNNTNTYTPKGGVNFWNGQA